MKDASSTADAADSKGPPVPLPDGLENEVRKWIRNTVKGAPQFALYESCMDWFAEILIHETLDYTGGNRSLAAELLGLSRPTLHAKMVKFRLMIQASVKKDRY